MKLDLSNPGTAVSTDSKHEPTATEQPKELSAVEPLEDRLPKPPKANPNRVKRSDSDTVLVDGARLLPRVFNLAS